MVHCGAGQRETGAKQQVEKWVFRAVILVRGEYAMLSPHSLHPVMFPFPYSDPLPFSFPYISQPVALVSLYPCFLLALFPSCFHCLGTKNVWPEAGRKLPGYPRFPGGGMRLGLGVGFGWSKDQLGQCKIQHIK